MARLLLISVTSALLLASCQQQKTSLAVTAETSAMTLNAENDVLGLVERYHTAKKRAEEYRQAAVAAELELLELQRKLTGIHQARDKAIAEQAAAEKAKTDAEAATTAATEAAAATAKALEAATKDHEAKAKALADLETKKSDVEARSAAATEFVENGSRELAVLEKEQVRLRDRLNVLRDRVVFLKTRHPEFAKRLAALEKEIEAASGQ